MCVKLWETIYFLIYKHKQTCTHVTPLLFYYTPFTLYLAYISLLFLLLFLHYAYWRQLLHHYACAIKLPSVRYAFNTYLCGHEHPFTRRLKI